ncbi:hypothetical protein IB292_02445 [Vibrio parahaemolyticus]|uniref:Uncharacterized protein n=1 Tax=Vibrio parahaemolyticus TaxID=670 RepID=A0A9Q3U9Q1_VIBPH|nr:hypothetical protein [Vibrio parahaemolyticus]MCC3803888.1 hypothetical protein [Vibrio parahaemolyticus]
MIQETMNFDQFIKTLSNEDKIALLSNDEIDPSLDVTQMVYNEIENSHLYRLLCDEDGLELSFQSWEALVYHARCLQLNRRVAYHKSFTQIGLGDVVYFEFEQYEGLDGRHDEFLQWASSHQLDGRTYHRNVWESIINHYITNVVDKLVVESEAIHLSLLAIPGVRNHVCLTNSDLKNHSQTIAYFNKRKLKAEGINEINVTTDNTEIESIIGHLNFDWCRVQRESTESVQFKLYALFAGMYLLEVDTAGNRKLKTYEPNTLTLI